MTSRRSVRLALAAAVVAAAGACTTQLQPAPGATTSEGPGVGALATHDKITVEARVDAWSGAPDDLERAVTPVFVRITNGEDFPVRLRFNEFSLNGGDGGTYDAIPPFDIEGEVLEETREYAYPVEGFTIAPYLAGYYPKLAPVKVDWDADLVYYETRFDMLRDRQLPTADMLRMALPEGWLLPGGTVRGFVYFEPVQQDEDRVTFRADLVNPVSGVQIGSVSIPFTETEWVP